MPHIYCSCDENVLTWALIRPWRLIYPVIRAVRRQPKPVCKVHTGSVYEPYLQFSRWSLNIEISSADTTRRNTHVIHRLTLYCEDGWETSTVDRIELVGKEAIEFC